MAGAPQPTYPVNTAGSLLAVLDACLVNGFNSISITTLTQIGNIASATASGAHNFAVGQWIEILGAGQAAYNGRFKVLSVAGVGFTFAVTGNPVSPATGTITARHPPAGWNRMSVGTNKTAYQTGAGSLNSWVQIEDGNPYTDSHATVRARMVTGLTALDTGTVLSPAWQNAKNVGGWMVVADHRTCYLFLGPLTSNMTTMLFGEFAPSFAADQFAFYLTPGRAVTSTHWYVDGVYYGNNASSGDYAPFINAYGDTATGWFGQIAAMRNYTQVGAPQSLGFGTPQSENNNVFGNTINGAGWTGHGQGLTLPNLADNTVPMGPIYLGEFTNSNRVLRGRMRGALWPLGRMPLATFVNNHQFLENVVINGVSQRVLLVTIQYLFNRQLAFPVDGEWV